MGAQWAAQWKVTSFTTDKTYTVSVAKTGRWACDCPAHKFARNPKPMCKHILKCRSAESVAISSVPERMRVPAIGMDKPRIVEVGALNVVIQTRREICLEED